METDATRGGESPCLNFFNRNKFRRSTAPCDIICHRDATLRKSYRWLGRRDDDDEICTSETGFLCSYFIGLQKYNRSYWMVEFGEEGWTMQFYYVYEVRWVGYRGWKIFLNWKISNKLVNFRKNWNIFERTAGIIQHWRHFRHFRRIVWRSICCVYVWAR